MGDTARTIAIVLHDLPLGGSERIAVRLAGLERPYTRRDMLQGRLPVKKSIVN